MITALPQKNPASLRDAQRAFTRTRICDAAREVFFLRGFGHATIDEIIQLAGISRSTLYAHFRDTEDLLAHIATEYTTALCEVAGRLPGPVPTRAQISDWVDAVAALIARERIPSILAVGLANTAEAPACIRQIGDRLFETLAIRLPAFRQAVENPTGMAMAWAEVAMRELGLASLHHARDDGRELGRNLLAVTTDLFARFFQDHAKEETK